jgi:hypothetical protein
VSTICAICSSSIVGAILALRRHHVNVRLSPMPDGRAGSDDAAMTLVWFIVWFVADRIGDREALSFHPVNVWVGTLLLAVALDLARQHADRPAARR